MRIKYNEGLIKDGNIIVAEDEKEVFTSLDLPYPSPFEREVLENKPIWMPKTKK